MKSLARTLAACCLIALTSFGARAQPRDLMLAVSEGTSGGLDHARVIAKYGGLADTIGRALNSKVKVVFAREFATLENEMIKGSFDFVFARPSDYPARGVRDNGYRFVASAAPDGQCLIIVAEDSPIRALEQAKGKRWVLPEQVSYMSKFCTAELRDRGIRISNEKVQYVREQGAVVFYLDNKLSDVGALASYSGPARQLEKTRHRVLHRSIQQPYFPLVAASRITPEQVRAIQTELKSLSDTEAGKAILKTIGIQAFDTQSERRLQALLPWLQRD
ncbi:MAG: phosphate ABC transporter substrate-binding protein [Leptothrix sp. (in: Bacteria)]|nr:phosphate ABC transporter substrate-binding protein [Leptothrix sp. (in: b-proteobacteria)]